MVETFVIFPLKSLYCGLYDLICVCVGNYGVSLILLSFLTVLLMGWLKRISDGCVEREKLLESILDPQIKAIKAKYKASGERHEAIKRLYSRYGYNPLYGLRSGLGLLIQLPFLFGAFWMLSSNEFIVGQSFLWIQDLSKPDGLLLGTINILPLLMTAVSFLTIAVSNLSRRELVQNIAVSLLFLVVLYNSASALLLYWTCNNCLNFVHALMKWFRRVPFDRAKQFALRLLARIRANTQMDFEGRGAYALIAISVLTPALTIWFNNVSYFGVTEIIGSFWLGAAVATVYVVIVFLLKKVVKKVALLNNNLTFILFVLIVASITMGESNLMRPLFKGWGGVICFCVLFSIYVIGRFKLINLILLASCVVVIAYGSFREIRANYDLKASSPANAETEVFLNKTPNIYYILCESMQSLDIARDVYGYKDGDAFVNFLKSYGFIVPDHVYSNSDYTLATLINIFTMSPQAWGGVGMMDVSTTGRDLIAGGDRNILLKILKRNGYINYQFFKGDTYFYRKKGPLLDYSDINSQLPVLRPAKEAGGILRKIAKLIERRAIRNQFLTNKSVDTDSYSILNNFLDKKDTAPRFFFHKLAFTDHTPSSHKYTDASEWIASGWYRNAYVKQVEAIKFYVKNIVSKDPDAIVIFMGDHGAWLYRTGVVETKTQLDRQLQEMGISYEQFLDDKFKVFGAVLVPKKYGNFNGSFNPSNIFYKIFNTIGFTGTQLYEVPEESYASNLGFAVGKPVLLK